MLDLYRWGNLVMFANMRFICFILLVQTAKGAKIYSAAVAATADGQHGREGEEKIKLHTHSYCCLDYAQVSFYTSVFCMYALNSCYFFCLSAPLIFFFTYHFRPFLYAFCLFYLS